MNSKQSLSARVVVLLLCASLAGCAGFKPVRIPNLEIEEYPYRAGQNGVAVAVRTFTPAEIKRYFASSLAKKNVWPVLTNIVNESEQAYLFSKGLVEPEVTSAYVAARKGRRAAGHRLFWGSVLTYSIIGAPIGLPLLGTGAQALGSNNSMESEYARREIADGEIEPGSSVTGILYFHLPQPPQEITFTFIDSRTENRLRIPVDLVHKYPSTAKMITADVQPPSVTETLPLR